MSSAPRASTQAPAAAHPEPFGRTPRHLWDYWRIFWEGRRILGRTLAGTVLVALVGTLLLADRYRAECLVEINLSSTAILSNVQDRGGSRSFFDADQEFRTEFVKIKTRKMIGRAIEKHDLAAKVPDLARLKSPIDTVMRVIDVERVTQTNVAKISVSWTDPKEAAEIANALAQTYVVADLEERKQVLAQRIANLEESLGQKSEVRRQLVEREIAIIKTDPPLDTILGLSTMEEKKTLQSLWADLKKAEQELSAAQGQFGPASLQIREKVGTRDRIRQQVDEAREAAVEELRQELVGLGGNPDTVAPSFMPVTAVQRDADDKFVQELYTAVNAARVLAETAVAKAHVIEPAIPPRKPYSPRLLLNLALAVVVGLGFGGGYVLFRDYLDVSVKTLEDVEQDLGLNLLAVVPRHVPGAPDAVVKEAFQTLRTGLLFASGGRKSRVLLVTSGAPQEGKSSVVTQLVRSMAAAGESVVVVDCDMRRAGAGRLLGVRGPQGLSGYLADPKIRSWRDVVEQVDPKLAVIPTGPIPPNPVDLLGLARFSQLLAELREAHDWVILDSPPVSSVADSVVLGSLAEMVMVVMRHDRTDKEVIRRALQRLSGVGARIVGAVLNDVDMSKSYNRDYYYGRFYYGSYYGEDKEGGGKGRSGSPAAGATGEGLLDRLRNLLK